MRESSSKEHSVVVNLVLLRKSVLLRPQSKKSIIFESRVDRRRAELC